MRHFDRIAVGLAVCLAAGLSGPAPAQDYPQKPIRIITPFPGLLDVLARAVGTKLTERVKQPVVVENKLGAGGNIAYETVARSAPDGHTLIIGANTLVVNPSLYKNLPFDPLRDFAPITLLATQSFFLVVQPSSPAGSALELIALAKSRPGQLSYGSAGIGTLHHLAGEMFRMNTGAQLLHVPYKGAQFAMTDFLAGRLDVMFLDVINLVPQLKAGKLRVLATLSGRRESAAPEAPTLAEAGVPGIVAEGWYGMLAPAGTPAAIITRLNQELVAIIADPELRRTLSAQGAAMGEGQKPEQFAAFIRAESAKWAHVVKSAGVKVE